MTRVPSEGVAHVVIVGGFGGLAAAVADLVRRNLRSEVRRIYPLLARHASRSNR